MQQSLIVENFKTKLDMRKTKFEVCISKNEILFLTQNIIHFLTFNQYLVKNMLYLV